MNRRADPLDHPSDIHVTDPSSYTGDVAWAGSPRATVVRHGQDSCRDGAVAIGDWIQAHCRDDRGPAATRWL